MEHTFHMFYSPPPVWVCSECGSVFKFSKFDTDESLIYLKIGTATKNNDQPISSIGT
jgi:hypothetical protein